MTREEARALIEAIKVLRENATDEQALKSVAVYPFWKTNFAFSVGDRIQHNGILYKCTQGHTSQDNWTPDVTPALWIAVSIQNGTADQPITAVRGMEYEEGKYYLDREDNNVYLCTRSGILQYMPHELIGHYFALT